MKKFLVFLFLILFACSYNNYPQRDSDLIKTKIYVGRYKSIYPSPDGKYCFITTSMGIFRVKDCPDVPDSALCYIRRQLPAYDMHPDIRWQMEKQLFTWNGTEDEYDLKKNIRFDRIIK
jgi:hypothetical protein